LRFRKPGPRHGAERAQRDGSTGFMALDPHRHFGPRKPRSARPGVKAYCRRHVVSADAGAMNCYLWSVGAPTYTLRNCRKTRAAASILAQSRAFHRIAPRNTSRVHGRMGFTWEFAWPHVLKPRQRTALRSAAVYWEDALIDRWHEGMPGKRLL